MVCGHGATCGRIDEQMLFFLRSRGIDKAEAERMLVLAFLAEAIELIGDEAIVAALEARTRRWLGIAAGDASDGDANGAYDVEKVRADFPILPQQGLRQAARLSRQCRFGAEAAGGARPHHARLHAGIRQRAPRAALPRERRDRGL